MAKKRNMILLLTAALVLSSVNASSVYAAEGNNQTTLELNNFGVVLEKTSHVTDRVKASNSLPSSYRNTKLPAIRNQNPYGSCWAFTSVGLAEADLLKDGVKSIDLSELHLAYFNYNSVADSLGGISEDKNYIDGTTYNYLTLGGDMAQALYTMAAWKGVEDEDSLPYAAASDSLKNGVSASHSYNDIAHMKAAYVVNITSDRESVKQLIIDHGAVGINYCDSNQYYYSEKNCYYSGKNVQSNHAVMIVGWDDNFSKSNFKGSSAPSKDGAWLIRNSWGKEGDDHNGYFWLSYEEPSISSNAYAFDFVYKGYEGYYDNNYQYDGGFANSYMVYSSDEVSYANVFTANASEVELLKAVGVRFCEANVNYTVNVYVNITDKADPSSGELAASVAGATSYEGYYTLPLDSYVELVRGQTYSVVVTQDKGQDAGTVVAVEGTYSWPGVWISKPSAKAGQSFIKSGTRWVDYGAMNNANVRIKAYTDNDGGIEKNGEFSVKYVLNGGIQNPANSVKYTSGKATKLFDPKKEDAEFGGWCTDEACTKFVKEIGADQSGNITLYAYWKNKDNETVLEKPELSTIDATSNYIELQWEKVANADGYYIYRKAGAGKWKKIKTIEDRHILTYYDESSLSNGIKYQYRIVAYVKRASGEVTEKSANKTIYYLTAPEISYSQRINKKKVKLAFAKNKKASGYEIQYSTKYDYKGAKKVTVKKMNKTSVTLSGVKKGKTYYVRIRSYKKSGKKKYYGYWKNYIIAK